MFYDLLRWYAIVTAFPFQKLFFKTKVYYENGDRSLRKIKGGALIISNHFNVMDYGVNMFLVLPRKLHVVASEYAYRNPFISFGMRFWGGIQANRITKSMRFVDISADLIKKGKLVQIFPEGQNTDDGTIKDFKPSYIAIAHRANAPIVPIVLDGNYGWFKRAHAIVGKPIDISPFITTTARTPSREELASVNQMVRGKVLELRQELERLKTLKQQ